jgi:hypothetical protein
MKTAWRLSLIAAIVLALLVGMLLAAAWVWGVPHELVRVFIDGERIDLPPAGHWLVASLVLATVALALMAVLPLALLLGLGIPLLVLGVLLAVALAPLLLPVVLVVWLLKRPARVPSSAARP